MVAAVCCVLLLLLLLLLLLVGFRICDDVPSLFSKSMFPLEFCGTIDVHARILERSVSESVMTSQVSSQNRCCRLSFVAEKVLTLALRSGRFQNL